jgi:hypothetical protein
MAEAYSGPSYVRIRKSLTDLVTLGLSPYSVAEKGAALVELEILIRHRRGLNDNASDDERDAADADALLALLEEAVHRRRIASRKFRRVLRFVLPIYTEEGFEQYRDASLEARRTAAGQNLTGNEHDEPVEPSTIRTYYEPKALSKLAVVLIHMESEHRGETPPDDLPNVG